MKEKYINPFTDFGFKKLFGEEANKDFKVGNFNPKEQQDYQDSLKYYRDLKNVMNTAIKERLID